MGKSNVVHPPNGILSVINRKELLIYTATYMNLRDIILSRLIQAQKVALFSYDSLKNVKGK